MGIDPGIATIGYSVIAYENNHFKVITYGVVETKPDIKFSKRLQLLYEGLQKIIDEFQPECCAVEELFFNKNVKTAISVGHGRGVILLLAEQNNLPTYEYTPLQVKQGVVGYGRAEKKQVQEMVKLILNLAEIPKPDDAADALAVAICHAHAGKFGKLFRM